jgi:hypothetical protein
MEAEVNEMPNDTTTTPAAAATPPGGAEALSKPAKAKKKRTFGGVLKDMGMGFLKAAPGGSMLGGALEGLFGKKKKDEEEEEEGAKLLKTPGVTPVRSGSDLHV